MLARELVDIPLQMLGRHLVKRPLVRPFQHRPEGLNAVGMRHPVHILADRVLDRFMRVRDALIRGRIIGINDRIITRLVSHEVLQRGLVGGRHNLCTDLIGFAVFGSDNCRHVHRPASFGVLALRIRLVIAFAPDIGLVKLDMAIKRAILVITRPCLADAVHHEPGTGLTDSQIPVQLHAGHGFKAGHAEVNGDGPFAQGNARALHWRPRAHAEIGAAIAAPVRHRLGVWRLFGVGAAATRAMTAFWPDAFLEPFRSRLIGRKHIHHFNNCDALAVCFAGCWVYHNESPILIDSCIGTGGRFVKSAL